MKTIVRYTEWRWTERMKKRITAGTRGVNGGDVFFWNRLSSSFSIMDGYISASRYCSLANGRVGNGVFVQRRKATHSSILSGGVRTIMEGVCDALLFSSTFCLLVINFLLLFLFLPVPLLLQCHAVNWWNSFEAVLLHFYSSFFLFFFIIFFIFCLLVSFLYFSFYFIQYSNFWWW